MFVTREYLGPWSELWHWKSDTPILKLKEDEDSKCHWSIGSIRYFQVLDLAESANA